MPQDQDRGGMLAANIIAFARILRRAGVPVGPAHAIDAVRAVEAAGLTRRDDFYWTLHAVFVSKHEHHPVFDAAFEAFWRSRNLLDKMMELMSPVAGAGRAPEAPKAGAQRVADAMRPRPRESGSEQPRIELDASLTASEREILQSKDFEQMSAEEIALARVAVRALVLPLDKVEVRRQRASPLARRIDPRRTMRASLRGGGDLIALRWRERDRRPPPIVALCDISGSMSEYTRLFLHFLHALSARRRVTTFLFGTRLTNVTRPLQRRDPDEALAACAGAVEDWSGGTRIAAALHAFNRDWSRRVMAGGPIVLLMTDGLEREADPDIDLELEIDRLHRSCRRLVWLNPLLRYDRFEAKAHGIRTLLPHVDEFRPVHSLASVAELALALAEGGHDAGRLPRVANTRGDSAAA